LKPSSRAIYDQISLIFDKDENTIFRYKYRIGCLPFLRARHFFAPPNNAVSASPIGALFFTRVFAEIQKAQNLKKKSGFFYHI